MAFTDPEDLRRALRGAKNEPFRSFTAINEGTPVLTVRPKSPLPHLHVSPIVPNV